MNKTESYYEYFVYLAIKVTQTTEEEKNRTEKKYNKKVEGVWRHNIFESQKRNIVFCRINKLDREIFYVLGSRKK